MYISVMKELDKTKAYDLRDLNDEQLREFKQMCRNKGASRVFEEYLHQEFLELIRNGRAVLFGDHPFEDKFYITKHYSKELVNALTLFEPKLKVGDTFEKDGFICRVESEVMKWYVVDRGSDVHYTTLTEEAVLWLRAEDIRVEGITDQEFIKQLEKHAR